MTETIEVLKAARELISDEKRWTRGKFARSVTGRSVDYESFSACSFCSVGALMRVTTGRVQEYEHALCVLIECMDGDAVGFNDTRSHTEVLSRFDAAIARLA